MQQSHPPVRLWLAGLALLLYPACKAQRHAPEAPAPAQSRKVAPADSGPATASGAFGNEAGYAWALTPRGKMECRCDSSTGHLQVITLDGKVVFKEEPGPDGILQGETLQTGLRHANVGVPAILANRDGLVVMSCDPQPPHYGITGYLIIDFNRPTLPITLLGEGQRPQDDRIPDPARLRWSQKGVTLRYFGYRLGEESCTAQSPKPGPHETFFDAGSQVAIQVR